MPPHEQVVTYLARRLPAEAECELNAMGRMADACRVMKVWNRQVGERTRWFYEGTQRAVVYACIARWLKATRNVEWLLLAEQPYPMPGGARADIALFNAAREWIFIELKADFGTTGPRDDIDKLLTARSELRDNYVFGLLLYAVWDESAVRERWHRELDGEMEGLHLGCARPLIRR